jgi:putative oxidoreductase
MYETLAGAGIRLGIPFYRTTYFASSVEFIGGCLLVIGLLSSLCSAALIIDMTVAIITVRLATIRSESPSSTGSTISYFLQETRYIIILIWLICSGPGRFSVDERIFRAFE